MSIAQHRVLHLVTFLCIHNVCFNFVRAICARGCLMKHDKLSPLAWKFQESTWSYTDSQENLALFKIEPC